MSKAINSKILKNKEKIVLLLNNNIDLERQLFIKSLHRFTEETTDIGTKKEPKIVSLKKGYWYEWFKDEDTPNEKGVRVERTVIVEIDGVPSDGWNKITHYTINDI